MIKIIFFDIDGTILEFGKKEVSPSVKDALWTLHDKGIELFIATGRPPYVIPKFEDLPFDGALAFNGQYCYNEHGEIFSNPMAKDDVKTMVSNAKKMGIPVQLASKSRMGSNFFQQELEDYFRVASQHCYVVDDYDELLEEEIYQCMVAVMPHDEEALFHNTKHVKSTRWTDIAIDVIPDSGSKAVGMSHILKHYGLNQTECMAFGDGGNDREMIEYAHIGVAMGNATEDVKAVSDYVTRHVKEDGVVHALKHFELL